MDYRPVNKRKRAFSIEAEALVARLLRAQGWRILAQNFRHIGFELDLIATKGKSVVAVEVKARRSLASAMYQPSTLLDARKRAALERGLLFYVTRCAPAYEALRIDLAVVVRGQGPALAVHYFPNV